MRYELNPKLDANYRHHNMQVTTRADCKINTWNVKTPYLSTLPGMCKQLYATRRNDKGRHSNQHNNAMGENDPSSYRLLVQQRRAVNIMILTNYKRKIKQNTLEDSINRLPEKDHQIACRFHTDMQM